MSKNKGDIADNKTTKIIEIEYRQNLSFGLFRQAQQNAILFKNDYSTYKPMLLGWI